MAQLAMALIVEGETDARFLDVIAQRTALQILSRQSPGVVDVLPVQRLRPSGNGQAQRILTAAHEAHGYHLLLIHADADAPSPNAAWADRVQPGLALVRDSAARGEAVCEHCMAVIPVQMTEAWLLADGDALLQLIGTRESAGNLGLRHSGRRVETIADPKIYLSQILEAARKGMRPSRRRAVQSGAMYEPLARRMSLERLALLPSYATFHSELTRTLTALGFIPQT